MCDGSQLKDAVFDYVSDLSVCSDTTSLNYINNRIIPYKGSLEQYIKLCLQQRSKSWRNHSNSDLGEMLSMILQEMTDTSVSIFISDCILDLPVSNSQKILSRCQISIKNAINEGRNRIPNLGVEIIKWLQTLTVNIIIRTEVLRNWKTLKGHTIFGFWK